MDLVLELGRQGLPQHLHQAAAERLDLLLHVQHRDVVTLLRLGLDPLDDQVFAIDHRAAQVLCKTSGLNCRDPLFIPL